MVRYVIVRLIYCLALSCVVVGCDNPSNAPVEPTFLHDVTGDILPWTKETFDATAEKFTFAVHSDLTGGEREGIYEIAIAQLNLLRPEFIINVGDLIEGDSDEAIVDQQWDSFNERAGKATAPVIYVPGNHDRTGQLMQEIWDRRVGPGYFHFRYKDVLFLVLDTEDNTAERMQEIHEMREYALQFAAAGEWDKFGETPYSNMPENQGGNIGEVQSQYMMDAIADNSDVRWTFLFMHKAPWMRDDLSAFTAIENSLSERPYSVFHGHVHSYQHQERRGRDYIRLATTGGVQLPDNGRSMDHVTLVTVDENGVDIANLLMNGILDKTGHIPLGGDEVCFELEVCGETE